MPITNKEKMQALFDVAKKNLEDYIHKVSGAPRLYTAAELDAIDRTQARKIKRIEYPGAPGPQKYIYLGSHFRNEQLLALRLLNVMQTMAEIRIANNEMNQQPDLDQDGLEIHVQKLENALIKGDDANHALSVEHGKYHASIQQNLFLGMGLLASLWNRTWFQSRANRAFEKCFSQLREFKKTNFGDANFARTPISIFYLGLKATVQAAQRRLSRYLSQAGYQRAYSKDDADAYDRIHGDDENTAVNHPGNSDRYILSDRRFANKYLSSWRIHDVLQTIGKLQSLMRSASKDLDVNGLNAKLESAQQILLEGKAENVNTNQGYNKTHVSYLDSREQGLNCFASLWNRTLFQSRANTAYEEAIVQVDQAIKVSSSFARS